jgi:multiple sugar transport system permease protein
MAWREEMLRTLRGIALALIVVFFLFPIVWILLMSFETNETVLRVPPTLTPHLTLQNYVALLSGKLVTATGIMNITFLHNLWNSVLLSTCAVAASLVLGVPAAYAFARFRFRGREDIAFTLLSFRFAPPLLVLLPLSLYFQDIGLSNTYLGLIWIYQLICLPLILWIVRGYFEDASPDIEYAYRVDGHSWWRAFTRIAIPLASADKQPVTVGALAFVTASGIQYGIIAAAIVLSILPTLALALFAQRWLVEGLSLGAVKG